MSYNESSLNLYSSVLLHTCTPYPFTKPNAVKWTSRRCAAVAYTKGPGFMSRLCTPAYPVVNDFLHIPHSNSITVPQIRPRPLPPSHFAIHRHPSIWHYPSELLTSSLNNQKYTNQPSFFPPTWNICGFSYNSHNKLGLFPKTEISDWPLY